MWKQSHHFLCIIALLCLPHDLVHTFSSIQTGVRNRVPRVPRVAVLGGGSFQTTGIRRCMSEDPNQLESNDIPKLDLDADCETFFGNPYFYDGDAEDAERKTKKRQAAFEKAGNPESARKFLMLYKSWDALEKALYGSGIQRDLVKPYWEEAWMAPEDQLNGTIITVNNDEEIDSLHFIENISPAKLRDDKNSNANEAGKRARDIHLVLGSSGSGKTCFAVKQLGSNETMQARYGDRRYFTVYMSVMGAGLSKGKVIQEIRERLKNACKKHTYTDETKLDMNVCFILDEAGALQANAEENSTDTSDYFLKLNDIESLERFQRDLKDGLLTKESRVRLVVAGTGYDSIVAKVSSQNDVFKYDMQPWETDDLIELVSKKERVGDKTSRAAMKNCLKRYPILASLGGNPRIAHSLINGAEEQNFLWLNEGTDLAPLTSLISSASRSYVRQNGLRSHSPKQRAKIAKAVFAQLEASWANPTTVPEFESLKENTDLIPSARSLVEQNYEISNNTVKLLDENAGTIKVTPAIVIVLYSLLNASANLLGGWKNLENLLGLAFLRQRILEEEDDNELINYGIRRLHTVVPGARSTKNWLIPDLPSTVCWVNGDPAPFADCCDNKKRVGQAKFTATGDPPRVNLMAECMKMGLFNPDVFEDDDEINDGNDDESRKKLLEKMRKSCILRVCLLESLRFNGNTTRKAEADTSTDTSNEGEKISVSGSTKKGSKFGDETSTNTSNKNDKKKPWFYPEELLVGPEKAPIPMVRCSVNEAGKLTVANKMVGHWSTFDSDWEGYFVTNAPYFNVTLNNTRGEAQTVSVFPEDVDEDGRVSNTDVLKWSEKYLRPNATVRFVFAGGDIKVDE